MLLTFAQMGVFATAPFFSPLPISSSVENIEQICQNYKSEKSWLWVSPRCLLLGKLPSLTLTEKIELFWDFLIPEEGGYDPALLTATYRPQWFQISTNKSLFPLSEHHQKAIQKALQAQELFFVPVELVAGHFAGDLALFSSHKDISNLSPCTKHNYLLAFEHLDGKKIAPWETFNLNTYLVNLKGYCTGQGEKNFLFYGGVCGVASQLFRASLTSPQIRVDERHGHNDRYARYYGNIVDGDDAAVYERSKKFIIINTSETDIIIKTSRAENETVLYFVTDAGVVDNQRVEINKNRTSSLSLNLHKTIYQKSKSETECKNLISPFFRATPVQCEEVYLQQAIAEQQHSSRYLSIKDRSL